MQKVILVNPVDGDSRAELNGYLQKGFVSMFHIPVKDDTDNLFLYYHLIKEEDSNGECEHDKYDEDDETDTEVDAWEDN